MERLTRKKLMLYVFATLALFALAVFAGGCGGGSSSPSTQAKLYIIGDIDAATIAKLNKANITTVQFDPSMTKNVADGSSFVLQEQGMQLVSADETEAGLADMLSRCYSTGGEIVLLSSDKAERNYLLDTVLDDYDHEDRSESVVAIFAVTRETDGVTRTFISNGDAYQALSSDQYYSAVKSADQFYIQSPDIGTIEDDDGNLISGDILTPVSDDFQILFPTVVTHQERWVLKDGNGNLNDDANFMSKDYVISTDYIVASGDTLRVSCDMVESGDVTYQMTGDGVVSYDNTGDEEAEEVIPEDTDDEEWEALHDWLLYEESEADAAANARMAASVKSAAGSDAEIDKLFESNITTFPGELCGKPYTINVYVVPMHNFNDNTDWYAVRQEYTVNTKKGYEHTYGKKINGRKSKMSLSNFMHYVYADNSLCSTGDISNVLLTKESPLSFNKETTHSETRGFHIGGEIGVGVKSKAPEASAKLSAGASWNKSASWKSQNVSCSYTAKVPGKVLSWKYTFNELPKLSAFSTRVTWQAPTDSLSRTTLKFETFWVWRLPGDARAKKPYLSIDPHIQTETIYCQRGLTYRESWHRAPAVKHNLTLLSPPLLALKEHEVAIDGKSGSAKDVQIASQGDCSITKNSASDWCYAQKVNKTISIRAKNDNTTGEARKAQITVKRAEGALNADTQVLTVIQHPKY